MNKRKVPKLRFKGFTDDWEQRKLGELAEIKDSARIPNAEWSESGVPYIRASDITNEDASGVLFISHERYEFYKNKTGAPAKGDVLFNGGGEIGKTMLNSSDSPIYVQGGAVLYARTSVSDSLDGQYLKTYFETPNAQHYFETASAGGTMKHFTLKPSQEMPIKIPKIEEQKRIGECFSELDNLITLHQRKLEKLKIIKKSMLENCFPKNGEKIPKFRFDGFSGDWEQRKCGDMTVELSEYETLQSGYPLLTSSRNGLMFQNEFRDKTSTDNDETLFSVVPYGKCTYRHMSDDNIFHFNINTITENGLVSREYPVFDASEDCNLSFLIQYLNSSPEFTKFCSQRKLGGTRTRLYYKNLCDFNIFAPSKDEQDKIANYLENIDNLITLHQRKLEKLKVVKKSMLESMFV